MVELPVDILFEIIEEIGMQKNPDFDLLWAFCSTCRTVRPHAQKFLFQSLSLKFTKSTPHSSGPAIGIFWEHMEFVLEENPHIAEFVKYIQFRAESPENISSRFVALLSRFTTLKTLHCGYEEWGTRHWGSSMESYRGWERIFRLPSVHNLHILGILRIPISALFPCTNLRFLYIGDCTSFEAPGFWATLGTVSHLPLANIVNLKVQTAMPLDTLEPLFSVYPSIGVSLIDRSTVQHLFVGRVRDEECVKLSEFPSLRSFNVNISLLEEPSSLFASFSPCSLKSLIRLGMEFDWSSDMRIVLPSMALAVALGRQSGFPALGEVMITIACEWEDYPGFKNGTAQELRELDQLFASTTKFPCLHTVTIRLEVYTESLVADITRFWLKDSGKIAKYLPLFAVRSDCTLIPLVRLAV